jgi:hypothetical protein
MFSKTKVERNLTKHLLKSVASKVIAKINYLRPFLKAR